VVTRGLAPRRRKAQETQLDSNEIQELTRRGNTERDAYDAERVAGLGFAPYAPPPSSPLPRATGRHHHWRGLTPPGQTLFSQHPTPNPTRVHGTDVADTGRRSTRQTRHSCPPLPGRRAARAKAAMPSGARAEGDQTPVSLGTSGRKPQATSRRRRPRPSRATKRIPAAGRAGGTRRSAGRRSGEGRRRSERGRKRPRRTRGR
jgi:hypothetical protein